MQSARDKVILPALDKVMDLIGRFVNTHKSTPMLARTHGQPAVPTTAGKELAVFYTRLKKGRRSFAAHNFEAKLNGAVGNYNALVAASPGVDWLSFSEAFIRGFGLEPESYHHPDSPL